jgi:hypothetical protein
LLGKCAHAHPERRASHADLHRRNQSGKLPDISGNILDFGIARPYALWKLG